MPYEMQVNAGVSGQQQLDSLTTAVDKGAAAQSRIAKAIQDHIATNEKLSGQQAKLALQEVQLEQLREKHRMALERLAAAATRGAAGQDALSAANTRVAGSSMAAGAALRTLEGAMPLRAAANFLGTLQGIGPALQVAFPLFGAIAFAEVLGKIGTNLIKFFTDLKEQPQKIQLLFRELNLSLQTSNDELRLSNDRIADTIAKLEHKPRNVLAEALDEARVNADKLAQSLDNDVRKVEELIKQNSVSFGARLLTGAEGTKDIEKQFGGFQRVIEDINFAGNQAVHAAKTPEQARQAQKAWDDALAGARAFEQRKISGQITQAEAPRAAVSLPAIGGPNAMAQAFQPSRLSQEIDDPALTASRLAMLRGISQNLTEQGDAAQLRTRAAQLQGELPKARAQADAERAADSQAKRRLELTRKTDHWLDEQKKKQEEVLDREGLRITKETEKGAHEQLKEAMTEGAFDITRFFPHELKPLTGGETIAQMSARVGHQERMAAIAAGPEDAAKLAIEQTQRRLGLIDAIKDRELAILDTERDAAKIAEINDKAKLDASHARYELEEKIAELQKKQKQEFEALAVGFLGAGRSGGGRGLQQFMKGELNKLEDTAVSRIAGMAWGDPSKGTGIGGQLAKVIPAGGPLDKLFGLGVKAADPMKIATDANTLATIQNTAALREIALSRSGGGGSWGGLAGGGSAVRAGGGYSDTGEYTGGGGGGDGSDAAQQEMVFNDAYDPSAAVGGTSRGGFTASKGIGIAGAAAAAAFGAYSGFKKGSAQGALSGVGSLAGGAGSIMMLAGMTGPAAPIVAGIGLGLGLISGLLGDPVANRQREIQRTLQHSQYMAPVAVNATMSSAGTYSDLDRFGNVRDSNFSPFPTVQQGFFDYRNGVTVPGRTLGQFGGPGGGGNTVVLNVNAVDAKSILDRHAEIGDAVARSLERGSSPHLAQTLSGRV